MKILFFDFVIHYGGGPQLAADTMLRLSKSHDVEVIDPYGQCEPFIRKLEAGGVKVHVLMPESRFIFLGTSNNRIGRFLKLVKTFPHYYKLHHLLVNNIESIAPDVIWTNSKPGFTFLSTGWRLRKVPLVMEMIGCQPASFYADAIGRQMRKRLSLVMAISTETAKELKTAGFPSEKIKVVYDTIDFKDTTRRSLGELEAPLPGLAKKPLILVPATLIPKKGHATAIRAMARLKAAGHDPTLWIAGDVVGRDNSYEIELKSLAKQLKVDEDTYFLGWRGDVPAIMVRVDMVVLPTHEEGFGHVILEAMLLKRPVLTTKVGGIKDYLVNGQNGLVFPVQDDAMLAEQIVRLINDASLAHHLVDNGYTTVTKRFSPQAHTDRCVGALNSIYLEESGR